MLCVFIFFLLVAFYRAWEEQYEKAYDAGKANDASLHQTHEYWGIIAEDRKTIDSLTSQIGQLHSKIEDILLESDPSAKAVKKKAKILSEQISKFISAQELGGAEYNTFTDKMEQEAKRLNSEGKTNVQEVFDRMNFVIHLNEEKRIAYWRSALSQFDIQYWDRILSIQKQINELGYPTPKLDGLLAKQPSLMPWKSEDIRRWVISCMSELATELHTLSDQIKESP
jgi:hypothetical protein